MPQPIEETITIFNDFPEFMTSFPGIYRKISHRLNHGVDVQQISVYLNTTQKVIYSFDSNETQTFLYLIRGNKLYNQIMVGCGVSFGDQGGVLLPIAATSSHSNIRLTIQSLDLMASLSVGEDSYEFYILFL